VQFSNIEKENVQTCNTLRTITGEKTVFI